MSKKGNNITVYIHPGCDSVVGEYDFLLETATHGLKENYVYDHPDPVYLLFNPWCKG